MGILNATPDSFSDGGRHAGPDAALAMAREMVAAGAAWLDVGGESTRPGAEPVTAERELERVLPVLEALRGADLTAAISIDTAKASVAAAALDAGAVLVNDVTAAVDPEMLGVVASAGAGLCLMHMQGQPRTMQDAPRYGSVVDEVEAFLADRMAAARRAGIADEQLVLDPGIGFGKTLAHNLALLRALPRLERALGRPLLVGVSRKRMIPAMLGVDLLPEARDPASHLLHVQLAPHCALLRVHDVPGAAAALRLGLWGAA